MKKLLTTFSVALMTLVAVAQTTNTISFMGIPVDGSKFEVEQRLRTEKGFTYENNDYRRAGILSGNFNCHNIVFPGNKFSFKILASFYLRVSFYLDISSGKTDKVRFADEFTIKSR